MTPVAIENPVSTAAGGKPITTPENLGNSAPVVAERLSSAAAGADTTAQPTGPVQTRAAEPELVFEAHFLEVSSRATLPVTAAAYAGLRGRTISAEHLVVQNTDTFPTHWAAEVKGGNVFWMHYDGMVTETQDIAYLKAYGKWVRWQQRRGCFWSLALPRQAAWLKNPTVISLALLPRVHRIRSKAAVILTNAPWLRGWDLARTIRQLGREAENLAVVHPDALDPLAHYRESVKRIRITNGRRQDPLDISGKRARRAAEEHSALGGLRDAAVSVSKLAGWSGVGLRLNAVLDRILQQRGT